MQETQQTAQQSNNQQLSITQCVGLLNPLGQTLVPLQQNKNNRINVSVRVKPLNQVEKAMDKNNCWRVCSPNSISNLQTKEQYQFDQVYSEQVSTSEIFEQDAKRLVLSALEGYNVTIFAYGQTSSGKTFTMRGTDEQLGIIPLALQEIFKQLNENWGQPFSSQINTSVDRQWSVRVSYLEIYNECINDLLESSNKNLNVKQNYKGHQYIEHLTEYEVNSYEDTMKYLYKGDEQRQIAETRLNEKSSRSHTVFRINIFLSERNIQTGRNSIKTSQVNLVDLAGSEAASKTQSEGMRFREGSNINKSLLALSTVIAKLGQKYARDKPTNYINFRDSKLTRILQTSLQGNSQTAIICTISQLFNNMQESRETLNFGKLAKNVKTIVNVNEIVRESPEEIANKLQQLNKENEELKQQIKNQEEIIEMFERDKIDYENLGALKSHQQMLMQMIENKNELLDQKDKEIEQLTEKIEEVDSNNQKLHNELQNMIAISEQNFKMNQQIMEERAQKDEFIIQLQCNLEKLTQDLMAKEQELQSLKETIQTQLEDTMYPGNLIPQKSKLEISDASILTSNFEATEDKVQKQINDYVRDNLILMKESEALKSTIEMLSDKKDDLELQVDQLRTHNHDMKDQLKEERDKGIRLLQQLRAVRIESRQKDKHISKKNFQIQNLLEKIQILEQSNACLFKELDQSIVGMSMINGGRLSNGALNHSNLEVFQEYLNEVNKEQPAEQVESRRESQEPLNATILGQHHKAQMMELQIRIEILEKDKANLEEELFIAQKDLQEAENQIVRLAQDIRDMDGECMEILDQNEDLEIGYEELINQHEQNEVIIQAQKDQLQQHMLAIKKLRQTMHVKDQELGRAKNALKENEKRIKELSDQNEILKQNSRKRSRQEMQGEKSVHFSTDVESYNSHSKRYKNNNQQISMDQVDSELTLNRINEDYFKTAVATTPLLEKQMSVNKDLINKIQNQVQRMRLQNEQLKSQTSQLQVTAMINPFAGLGDNSITSHGSDKENQIQDMNAGRNVMVHQEIQQNENLMGRIKRNVGQIIGRGSDVIQTMIGSKNLKAVESDGRMSVGSQGLVNAFGQKQVDENLQKQNRQ